MWRSPKLKKFITLQLVSIVCLVSTDLHIGYFKVQTKEKLHYSKHYAVYGMPVPSKWHLTVDSKQPQTGPASIEPRTANGVVKLPPLGF